MGEAKRRGNFEERQLESITKRNELEKERLKQRKLWTIAHKPRNSTIALAAILTSFN